MPSNKKKLFPPDPLKEMSDHVRFLSRVSLGGLPAAIYLAALIPFILLIRYYILTRYDYWVPALVQHLMPAFFSLMLSLILIPICIKIAQKFKIVKQPGGSKAHFAPVPLLGGLGIYLSFLVVLLMFQPLAPEVQAIMIGSMIIVIMGTIDDIKPLSSIIRLIGQLVAAGIVISQGIKVSFMPHTWWGEIGAIVITIVWILGIVNATNFIDGVDGLATGYTMIVASFFFLIALRLDQLSVVLIASILIGVSFGFLLFNFKPAKIYLGDAGSTFLGFLLACIALYGGWSSWGPVIAIGIPVLILGVLIFDMIYITISRIKNGHVHNIRQWLDYRGEDHLHHRLIHLGFKEENAVVFIYSINIILGLSALVIAYSRNSFPVVVLLIQAMLIFISITILMLVGRQVVTK